MKQCLRLLILIALAATCCAQAEPEKTSDGFHRPTEWKPLPGGKACISYLKGPLTVGLTLFVDGSDPETQYSKIKVRVFDKDGKEISAQPFDDKDELLLPLYKNCRLRAGMYRLTVAAKGASKIIVGWRGEEVAFAVP